MLPDYLGSIPDTFTSCVLKLSMDIWYVKLVQFMAIAREYFQGDILKFDMYTSSMKYVTAIAGWY